MVLQPSVKASPSSSTSLIEYTNAALELLRRGYYHGLIPAVNECFASPNTFVVLDSPSGTGKTLAGVALRQLDCVKGDLGSRHGLENTRVAHIIWPTAVESQKNYGEIETERQKSDLSIEFIAKARAFNFQQFHADKLQRRNKILAGYLQFLFPHRQLGTFDYEKFVQENQLKDRKSLVITDDPVEKDHPIIRWFRMILLKWSTSAKCETELKVLMVSVCSFVGPTRKRQI